MSTMTLTAPKRIYLQVADGGEEGQPFPADHNDITWCDESVLENEVEYIRADLASPSQPAQAVDERRIVEAAREHGMNVEIGATYSLRGQIGQLINLVRALSDEKARPVDGWQPIETAPKDGSAILIADIQDGVVYKEG